MILSFDVFVSAFLSKISEYELLAMLEDDRNDVVDGYLRGALVAFKKNCKYDLTAAADSETRKFNTDIADNDVDEIVEIISYGMVCQWLRPFVYQQENLQNVISTRDFSVYSPAELLMRVGNAYKQAQKEYTQMIREYSYNHGSLTELHL